VQNLEELQLAYFQSDLEKYYMIDIGMAMWSDGKIEMKKLTFT
jgi:hypothetical protein